MSHAVDLGRRLVALRWSLFDAAVALLLVSASAELRDGATTEWWIFAAPMVAGLLIRRRLPVLAVVLAGFGALGHHLDSAAVLEPLDLAVPLTLYTLAGGDRPRLTVAIAFATALVCPFLLGVFYVLGPSNEPPPPSPQATAKVKQLEDLGLAPYPKTDGSVPVKNPGGDATGEQSESDVVSAAAGQAILIALVLGLAFAFGDNARRRRLHLRTLETRAADLERDQRQRIALATAAERARITRELHDVVAHGLSVMVIQAQGGAAALARHPDRTAEALQNVITTGRASLDEMRRLLGLARHEPSEDPQLAPQPGIGALPDLIERMRAAGARVAFTVHGDPVSLPASLDLTAYRIVQEALTNTIQHAGAGATTAVELDFRPDALTVEVQDDGDGPPAAPAAAEGNGLRGIAERVGMLGGELAAGPAESGGFLVRAVLPLRTDEVPGVIRVVVVDDQALVRAGFTMILDETDDIEVVGEADDGVSALEVVSRMRPDLVLMDVRMPNVDGIEATRRIRGLAAPPKVLILTTFDLDEYVFSGLRAGASGFLLKDALAVDLVAAVRAVVSGEAVAAPSVTRRLIAHFLASAPLPAREDSRLDVLTSREREVFTLIAHGHSNAEMARDLHLSEGTVKTHVGRILAKLQLRDRVHAVILGYECGLVSPGAR